MARTRPDPVIAEARARWNRCDEAEAAQRTAILEAKQFRAGNQWPDAIKIAREGGNAIQGQPPQPPRPCLVVDRLSPAIRQVSNSIKNASFGFDVVPNGGGADEETADIFKGYFRAIQNDSRGESPIEWAADSAAEGGLGWFRLRADYVHQTWDGKPTAELFDQTLKLERIPNTLAVYCDPSSLHPTRRTAQYMFVTEDMDREVFADRYPKADLRGLEDFAAQGDMKGWVTQDAIRIAEYWRITYETQTWYETADGLVTPTKPSDATTIKRTRLMRVPKVKGSKINAFEELPQADDSPEAWDWPGLRIPLWPILGEELNIDGRALLRGVIAEGMDAQRMVNYTYSGAVEIFALGPKAPWVIAAGQVENYKGFWQTANTFNYSYLPYDPVTIGNAPVPPPQRQAVEAPIQAAVELMKASEDAIKATTNIGDPSLGQYNPRDHSGRAIQALQGQSDLANSNYADNVRRALIDCGNEMAIVLPKIVRPGQILHVLGADDELQAVLVGQPFQQGPNGQPTPSPANITPEIAKASQGLHQFYDLNAGRYAVTVTVGKATATKREEGAAALGELIPHLPPEMAAAATPDYVRQLSFPGAEKIAERLEKTLPPALQPQEANQAIPPQAQAMIQGLQGQLQQLQQAIATDQVKAQAQMQQAQLKAQAELQKAQLDAQKEIHLQEMKNANAIAVARIGAARAALDTAAEAREERLSTGLQLDHEAQQAALDRAHEVGTTAMQHAHDAEQAQQAAQQQSQLAAQQASQQSQLAAQAQQAQTSQGGA